MNADDVTKPAKSKSVGSGAGNIAEKVSTETEDIKKNDDMATSVPEEILRIAEEYNRKIAKANMLLAQKDKEIQEANDAVQSLKQEAINLGDERNALKEKLANVEKEQHRLLAATEALKIEIQDSTNTNKKVEDLEKLINSLENDKAAIGDELHKMKDQNEKNCGQILQLVAEKKHLEEYIGKYEIYSNCSKEKERELENELRNKDRDLEIRTNELEEFKNKLHDTLVEVKKSEEKLMNENKKLQDRIKMKEAALTEYRTLLRDTRNEKESLQASVQDPQLTISDMQKQLAASRAQHGKERYVKEAQDTAYWELREKHQQVQNENACLQRNLADAQEQHAATNTKYLEEKRQRIVLLNRVSSTNDNCNVLQDSCERLRQTLSRCKQDAVTLHDTFNQSAVQLQELRCKQVQHNECIKHNFEVLHEKVSTSNSHLSNMVEYLTSAKQQVEGELVEARGQLVAAHARVGDLLTVQGDINSELNNHKSEKEKKDDMIKRLLQELLRVTEEYNRKIATANECIAEKVKEIQEANDAVQSLKQEAINLGDERNALKEKLANVEKEQHRLLAATEALNIEIQDSTNTNKKVEDLEKLINSLENDKAAIGDELHKMKDQNEENCGQIQQLVAEKKHLEEYIGEYEIYSNCSKEKERNLENELRNKDRDLEIRTNELEEFKNKLHDTLAEVKKSEEKLMNENKKLQDIIKMKEAVLTEYRTKLLETRNEKERLQASVQDPQQTISDMQNQPTTSGEPPAKKRNVSEPRLCLKKLELKPTAAPKVPTVSDDYAASRAKISKDFFTYSSDDEDVVSPTVKLRYVALRRRSNRNNPRDQAQTQQIPGAIAPNAIVNTKKTTPRKFFKHRAAPSKK